MINNILKPQIHCDKMNERRPVQTVTCMPGSGIIIIMVANKLATITDIGRVATIKLYDNDASYHYH